MYFLPRKYLTIIAILNICTVIYLIIFLIVDSLSAELNKIQLSDNTSAQANTTLNTSTDTIQNNTNIPNNTPNTNTEPITPTKQNSGSTRESDLFVLMLREARPGSPFKNKYVYN